MGSLEDRAGAREAGLRQVRRHHAGVGGPAGVQALGPGAVGQVLDDPAGLASAEPERRGELGRGQAEEATGGGGRAEGPAERGRVEASSVKRARTGTADGGHDLDAGDERRQHLGAGSVTGLPGGERRRCAARAGVDDGVLQRVIVVEPVGQGAIGEDGRGHPHLLARAPEARLGRPAQAARHRLDAARELLRHGRQRHAGGVQEEPRGLLDDVPWQPGGGEPCGEGPEPLGEGLHRSSRAMPTSPYHGPRRAVKDGRRSLHLSATRPRAPASAAAGAARHARRPTSTTGARPCPGPEPALTAPSHPWGRLAMRPDPSAGLP